jgi:hypothetical protein
MVDFILGSANSFNQVGGTIDRDIDKRVFMATAGEFDLLNLFRKVFGYRGIPLGVVKTDLNYVETKLPEEIKFFESKKKASSQSALGTPIFQPVKLIDPGRPKDGLEKLNPFLLPNEPLVTISGAKRLIETPSAGGTNDVIEHISLGFYQIKIQGFMVNMESDDAPEQEIRTLRSYYELRRSIKIESDVFVMFGIDLFAFKTISFPAVEGTLAVQGYEITGRSDKPIELELR